MAEPLRVLLVSGEYPPMEGGVGDFTHLLGEALAGQGSEESAGAEVHVLTSVGAVVADDPSPVVRHAVMRAWGWADLYGAAWRTIHRLRPDVINIQYQAAAYGMHPAIHLFPLIMRGIPCVVTFHDLLVPYLFPKAGPLRWRAILTLAHNSRAVIVTNSEDEQRLGTIGGLPRPRRIPIGSNIASILPTDYDRRTWRGRHGIAEEALVLCYFGFLNASKGGEDLIEAFDTLCRAGYNVHLLMIGGEVGASDPTNRAYLDMVRRTIAERGLAKRVTWTGFIAAEEVPAAFASADVCVLPYRDGVSFRRGSLMAALAHGMPIISTESRVPVPELVPGENLFLVPPADPQALAAAVVALSQNAQMRRKLSVGARQLAQEFDWQSIAARTLEVYHAVTGR